MNTPVSVKEKIKGAKPQRRTFRLNLRGDLVAALEDLDKQLSDVQERERESSAVGRLGGPDNRESTQIAGQIKELEAEMEDNWLDMVLEARPWAEWRDFKLAHPPVEEDQIDRTTDFHFDALIEKFMRTCVVEPDLDDEDWGNLFASCSPADLRDLGLVVYTMHERVLNIPKSRTASAILSRSADGSGRQDPGESQSDGSTDGSPSSSMSTSTPTDDPAEPPTPTPPS